jgi:hypothetical protein
MPKALTDYGPRIQEFLVRAFNEGVELDDPLATVKRTNKLELAGLIHKRTSKKGRTSWRCTDTGRGVVMEHVGTFMVRAASPAIRYRTLPPRAGKKKGRHAIDDRDAGVADKGYTHKPWRAMRGEGEVMGEAA